MAASEQHPPFTARCVASEEEAVTWGALCARGFSHRPGEPSRFYDKWRADPTGKLEWIRVVVAADGRLVGSVRIFDRAIHVHGDEVVEMAGLGEVCTDPDFRGRGVASHGLDDAIRYCESSTGARVSLLHAAAAAAHLYAKIGYLPLTVPYGQVVVDVTRPASSAVHPPRAPHWDDAMERGRLRHMHDAASRAMGIVGWTARDDAYWAQWMRHVSGGRLWVVDAVGAPLVYACIQRKPEGLKLCDFGCVPVCTGDGDGTAPASIILTALHAIAAHAIATDASPPSSADTMGDVAATTPALGSSGGVGVVGSMVPVLAPQPLIMWLQAALAAQARMDGGEGTRSSSDAAAWATRLVPRCEYQDDRWMVRPLHGETATTGALMAASEGGKFCVWQVDAF